MADYPGHTSAIVFTVGCNFRCGFCYNPELVVPDAKLTSYIQEDAIFDFLTTRAGKLDGVVVTGGEPTLHADLPEFLQRIKSLGFLVKLDTQGSRPAVVRKLLDMKLLDYIAMDIKGPLEKYETITNSIVDTEKIQESIRLIMNSNVPYEFRTTTVASQLSPEDFKKIGEFIQGARLYALQKFVPGTKHLDARFSRETTYSDEEFENLRTVMEQYVERCIVR